MNIFTRFCATFGAETKFEKVYIFLYKIGTYSSNIYRYKLTK